MTHRPTPLLRCEGWTDAQRDQLAQLERTAKPTDYQRGSAAALRVTASTNADRDRIAALLKRWGSK